MPPIGEKEVSAHGHPRLPAGSPRHPLDPQQTAALLATQGPALLLAVPGGGKTTVLVSRVAHPWFSTEGVAPQNILILTFNWESAQGHGCPVPGPVWGTDLPRRPGFPPSTASVTLSSNTCGLRASLCPACWNPSPEARPGPCGRSSRRHRGVRRRRAGGGRPNGSSAYSINTMAAPGGGR